MGDADTAMAAEARSPFAVYEERDVADLIAAHPLAWITAQGGGAASLLPLIAELNDAGRLTGLIGHVARRNPLVAALTSDPAASVLFTGPQAYVSPELVSQPGWAPTWNYAQLRIEGDILFDPAGGDAALALLVEHMEHGRDRPWRIADMGPRYERLRSEIIAFRVRIRHVEGRFKLGQDENVASLREILAGHPDPALVQWMRRMNADRL